jgi:tetratricopeptide (TPR) repeat protein
MPDARSTSPLRGSPSDLDRFQPHNSRRDGVCRILWSTHSTTPAQEEQPGQFFLPCRSYLGYSPARMRKHVAVLLFCFVLSASAIGSSPDRWVEVRSHHFVVISNSNEKNAKQVALQFERMRAVFHKLLPAAADDTGVPITVLALKDKKSFQTLEPAAYLGKGKLDLAGYFMRSADQNYILLRLDAQGDHPYFTVYHEYTHYMLRHDAAWLPIWLNEGQAEFFQTTEFEGKTVHLGEPSMGNLQLLRQRSLIPLKTLFQVDHSSPYYHEEDKGSIFYAEAWALTHYLMLNDFRNKTHQVQDYADLLQQHKDPISAAQQAFGDLNKLQQALNTYVQRSVFVYFIMKTPDTIDSSSIRAVPISTPDVDAIRADVLFRNQRTSEAETLLDGVLREDPNNALAHETMGMMKLRQGDTTAARKWFGEAVQLNSDSYLAHYYYAVLLHHFGGPGQYAVIESNLQVAIKLNPQFAPSYDALAMFYASRHEKFDEAHALNLHAVMLEPDNLRYRLNTAAVLIGAGKLESAVSVLHFAEKYAKTPGETETIAVRIDEIEKIQGEMERAKKFNQAAEAASAPGPGGNPSIDAHAANFSGAGTSPELIVKFKYPAGPPTGPSQTIQGTLHNVRCAYPSVITMNVESLGGTVFLYSNDFGKLDFKAADYTPQGKLHPCTQLEGRKARVTYAGVSDKSVNGQIVSVLLSK